MNTTLCRVVSENELDICIRITIYTWRREQKIHYKIRGQVYLVRINYNENSEVEYIQNEYKTVMKCVKKK